MFTYGSVCSGIESASVAWEPLGLTPEWFSEIEPFPCALLDYHWPHVPNWGDMSLLPDAVRYGVVSAPDILVGGTPCQAFSVAGKRESLADARGGLSLIYGDLLNAIDEQRGEGNEAVCVWENVPGVLSTSDNAFGQFLGLLAGEYALADCLSGRAVALEPCGKPSRGKSNIGWRWNKTSGTHHAKWPKSGCVIGPVRTVAWRVLDAQYFGVAQRRKRVFVVASARKGFDPASVLFEREGLRRDSAPSQETGQSVANCITAGVGNGDRDAQTNHLITGHRMVAFGEHANDQTASTMKARDYKDATDLVVHGTQDPCVSDSTAFALGRNNGGENVLCFSSKDYGGDTSIEISPTLRAGNSAGSNQNAGAPPAVSTPSVRRLTPVECERLQGFPDNHTLLPFGSKQRVDAELQAYYERHLGRSLTVDEYRAFVSDGPRYKAIGNSKAVPVVQWVGLLK